MRLLLCSILLLGSCSQVQLPPDSLTKLAKGVNQSQAAYTAACEPFPEDPAFANFCREAYKVVLVERAVYEVLNPVAAAGEVSP